MKIKLTPFAENMCESGLACLLTMVQGNVLSLGLWHWIVASQTGLLAGAIVGTTVIAAKLRQPFVVSLTLGAATTAADMLVHPATFVSSALPEAFITGVGAFLLSLLGSAALRRRRPPADSASA